MSVPLPITTRSRSRWTVNSLSRPVYLSAAIAGLVKDGSTTAKVYVTMPERSARGEVNVTTVTAISDSDDSVSDSTTDTNNSEKRPVLATIRLPIGIKSKEN